MSKRKSDQLLAAIGRKTETPAPKKKAAKRTVEGADAAAEAIRKEEARKSSPPEPETPPTAESKPSAEQGSHAETRSATPAAGQGSAPQMADKPVPKAKPAAKKKQAPKRSLSVVLTPDELATLQELQIQMQRTYQRSFGLSHGIKVMIRAFDLKSDVSAVAEALIAEDQRGKR